MIKANIVARVSETAGLTRLEAEKATDVILEAPKASILQSERIETQGFGVFTVKPRKQSIGRNLKTDEPVKISPVPTVPLEAWPGSWNSETRVCARR